jgi:uracil-DNA glycosylase
MDLAYIASALPRHMPLPDWAALRAAKLDELLLHHIALAAPKRLIVFGPHVSSLLGHDPANSADPARHFYHVGAQIPALAAPGLESLMARPRGKAALWKALLDWQGA